MTEKSKESVSALLDEEISEIELHRLLREYTDNQSIRESLISYQQIRAVVNGEHRLTTRQHLELHQRITSAVDDEEGTSVAPVDTKTPGQWHKPAAGFAVAASLFVAVIVGVNTPQQIADSQSATGETTNSVTDTRILTDSEQNLARESYVTSPDERQLQLRELDEEKQRRLREYLNQHDRMTRMNPRDTQTVIYDRDKGGKN